MNQQIGDETDFLLNLLSVVYTYLASFDRSMIPVRSVDESGKYEKVCEEDARNRGNRSIGDNDSALISERVRFSRCHDGTRLTDLRPLSSNAGRPSRAKGRRCIRRARAGHQPAQ